MKTTNLENYVNKLLEKNDKEVIVALYKQGMDSKEIQEELNMSRIWIEEVIEEFETDFSNDRNAEAECYN